MIGIIDYGAGNLKSVTNALEAVSAQFEIVRDAAGVGRAERIVLPGVGHFGQMMRALDDLRLRDTLRSRIAEGTPFFGICLGMQALVERSEEAPQVAGLGVLEGCVKRFPAGLRTPHMGWNTVSAPEGAVVPSAYYYFANSYYVPQADYSTGVCEYGLAFTATIELKNIVAVQFHPEKSGASGLEAVRRWVAC